MSVGGDAIGLLSAEAVGSIRPGDGQSGCGGTMSCNEFLETVLELTTAQGEIGSVLGIGFE